MIVVQRQIDFAAMKHTLGILVAVLGAGVLLYLLGKIGEAIRYRYGRMKSRRNAGKQVFCSFSADGNTVVRGQRPAQDGASPRPAR